VSRPSKVKRRGLPDRIVLVISDGGVWSRVARTAPGTWKMVWAPQWQAAMTLLTNVKEITHVVMGWMNGPPSSLPAWRERIELANPNVAQIGIWPEKIMHSACAQPDRLDAWLTLESFDLDPEELVRIVEIGTNGSGRRRVAAITARIKQLQEELVLLDAALDSAGATQPPTVDREIEMEERHA
jgi:hypothetical protein